MARTRRRKRNASQREFDPTRWAHLVFVLGGFMAAWVLSNFIESAWAMLWSYRPTWVPRANPFIANLSAIAIAIIGTAVAWRNKRWFKFITEVAIEISQVTWPTKAEIRAATVVVILLTLISSVLLFGMDQLWSRVTDLLYGI